LNPVGLDALLEFAVEIARSAGERTLPYFRNQTQIERKADGSFVTAADLETEEYLRGRIAERFPDDAIVGEEFGERTGSAASERTWIVDPIDGTFSFVHGVPMYGVLVGLEIANDAVLGVAAFPALGDTVCAARGQGCYLNGAAARVSSTPKLSEALVLSNYSTPKDATDGDGGLYAAAERVRRRAAAHRGWGDCYGHTLVATGRADVMLDPRVKIWDLAALLPIIEEAGGTLTDFAGRRTIRGNNAVTTNGILLPEVLDVLASA
jgi:histidinol-phosphatase